MKKTIVAVLLALVVFGISAEDSKVNLYGKFRLDYDLKKESAEADKPVLGGFNVDRARLGFKWTMSDDLKSKIELDTYDYELRIAEVTWSASEAFDLTVGRSYEVFAPESDWYGDRFDGITGAFDLGVAELFLQAGNKRRGADDGATALTIMPAVVVTPDFGDNGLEVGLNARYRTEYTDLEATTEEDKGDESAINFYTIIEVSDLAALVSVDFNSLSDSDFTNIDLNGDVNYTVSSVNVGSSVFLEDLHTEVDGVDMNTALEFYVGTELTDGFEVQTILALDNVAESNNGEMDYKFTLRFEWNPKYSF